MIHNRLYLIPFSWGFNLLNSRLLNHIQSFYMILFEYKLANLLEECNLLENQVDIQLLPAFRLAFVVSFHDFPVQRHSKQSQNVENHITHIDNEVEVLRSIWVFGVLLEDPITKFNLISKFAINTKKSKEDNCNTKEASYIGKSLIYLLEATLHCINFCRFSKVYPRIYRHCIPIQWKYSLTCNILYESASINHLLTRRQNWIVCCYRIFSEENISFNALVDISLEIILILEIIS